VRGDAVMIERKSKVKGDVGEWSGKPKTEMKTKDI